MRGAKLRISMFLRAHQGRSYTARQIANYLKLDERVVRRHLLALTREGIIDMEDDGRGW